MRAKRIARVWIPLGVLPALLGCGCSSANEESSGEPVERTGASSEPLLGICAPLTCCFPSGGGWNGDTFEDGLKALGCTTPQAYTESYGQSQWWLYSACSASIPLTELVAQYATVSPYYSQLVVNECLELHAVVGAAPTSVFVEWDPTCSSCYRAGTSAW
jgi:hypothetical protein